MKRIELLREALDTCQLLSGLREISHLSVKDQVRLLRLAIENKDLLHSAVAALTFGIENLMKSHPDSAIRLMESGLIPTERLTERESGGPSRKPRNEMIGRVYLMRNKRNRLVKIGFSKNPEVREATLQSEEPDIVLIHHREGCMKDELALHKKYASKRKRGEWFELSDEDVCEITGGF